MQEDVSLSRRRKRRRSPGRSQRIGASSLLLAGLLVGLVGALVYAWLVNPIVFANVRPANFSSEFRAEYLFLVSQSYAEDDNLERARSRLAELEESNLSAYISSQLDDYLRQGRAPSDVQNLASLAADLGVDSPVVAFFGPTPVPVSPTSDAGLTIPTLTPTLLPTLAPTASPSATAPPSPSPTAPPPPTRTPAPTFRLLSQQRVCLQDEPVNRIEVETLDAFLDPLPGVEIQVSWEGGQDQFFTGFKPTQGAGYADFTMEANRSYSLALVEGSPTVSGLRIEQCRGGLGGLPGGWRLVFQKLVTDSNDDS